MHTFRNEVNAIHRYPFRVQGLLVDILGKPTDWLWIVKQVGDDFEKLATHVHRLGKEGEKKIVCPVPVHGTEITSSKNLEILRASEGQAALYRGRKADGAEIQPGEVYALASADCPTVAIHDPESKRTLVCHFSRQSGIQGDILEKALRQFDWTSRARLVATVSLGIDPENFHHDWTDPTYGSENKTLTEKLISQFGPHSVSADPAHGGINLRYIAIEKLLRRGLREENIYADTLDTFSDPAYWSHRASNTPSSSKFGDQGRNMVLVANLEDTERLV